LDWKKQGRGSDHPFEWKGREEAGEEEGKCSLLEGAVVIGLGRSSIATAGGRENLGGWGEKKRLYARQEGVG